MVVPGVGSTHVRRFSPSQVYVWVTPTFPALISATNGLMSAMLVTPSPLMSPLRILQPGYVAYQAVGLLRANTKALLSLNPTTPSQFMSAANHLRNRLPSSSYSYV
jgi:hypothetical protein